VYVSRVDSDEFEASEDVGGFVHTLFADGASMPKGAVTTWHPSADFKEIWFYS
jgi:hypothetical protein